MAAAGPLVINTPQGLEIKGRRRLDKVGAFEALLEQLVQEIEKKGDQGCIISDCDVSQNKLSYEQFEALFTALGAHSARVLRFRMFGCATINDEVVRVIADYFRLLSQEHLPTEMHLSDCAITTEGFTALMAAFEETDLYPATHPGSMRPTALYLRLENNYISEAAIQEKVDAGIIKPFKKGPGSQGGGKEGAKVDLVVRDLGKYQQKQGEPPSPEEAPPPRQVHDRSTDLQQGGWQQPGQWQQPGGWQQPAWPQQVQARPTWPPQQQQQQQPGLQQAWGAVARPGLQQPAMQAMGWQARPIIVAPARATMVPPGGMQGMAPGAVGGFRPAAAVNVGGMRPNGPVTAWPRGSAGTAVDRSRTPAARINGGAGVVAGGKGAAPHAPHGAPPKKSNLPAPWEEQWSEEYQIPYFWNAENGESLWEKPAEWK